MYMFVSVSAYLLVSAFLFLSVFAFVSLSAFAFVSLSMSMKIQRLILKQMSTGKPPRSPFYLRADSPGRNYRQILGSGNGPFASRPTNRGLIAFPHISQLIGSVVL
jgi:hypothetical protein